MRARERGGSGFRQNSSTKPKVNLREVRVDSLLLVFGADSSRIRSAILDALDKSRRLALLLPRSATLVGALCQPCEDNK